MKNFLKKYCGGVKRLGRDRKGIAAVEFALLAPTVVLMFFSIVELSDALTANRKVAMAASTLADLASRGSVITYDDAEGMMTAVDNILSPYGINDAVFTLMSIIPDDDGDPIVDWSINQNLVEVYTHGTAYENLPDAEDTYSGSSLLAAGQSLIVVEAYYPFESSLSGFRSESFTFRKTEIRWPRIKDQIPYCDADDVCTDA